MNKSIRAIETAYDGYMFRSRLEARWAVVFKHLGVAYEYEKEAFDLGDVLYLPDFWLPGLEYWAEVKPRENQTPDCHEKLRRLAEGTGYPACFLDFYDHWPEMSGGKIYRPGSRAPSRYVVIWQQCPQCGKMHLREPGRLSEFDYSCECGAICNEDVGLSWIGTPVISNAFAAARSARFDGWWRSRTGSDLQPRKFGR